MRWVGWGWGWDGMGWGCALDRGIHVWIVYSHCSRPTPTPPPPHPQICFKGPCVFRGYLKNEEKTREALDDEGWLHSGDIGKWLPNGVLKIIDRKKQIFKTQQVREGSTGMRVSCSGVFLAGGTNWLGL